MNRLKMNAGDRVFVFLNYFFLSCILVIVLYPLIYITSSSFSSSGAVVSGRVWLLPVEPSIDGYKAVFAYKDIWTGYINSFYYAFFGTILNVVLTIMAAYPLSRSDFKAGNTIMLLFSFTMLFNGGLIPSYILVDRLGLIDTRMAMIIPTALSVWNVIITRTFFKTNLSKELLEAAKLDGCSDIRFIIYIAVPLSGAIIAVISLFYVVGNWNSFFSAFIYLKSNRLMPLQVKLRTILILNQVDPSMLTASVNVNEMDRRANLRELLKYSLIIVSSLPVLIIYPFAQKYFVKGVMIGSIKG